MLTVIAGQCSGSVHFSFISRRSKAVEPQGRRGARSLVASSVTSSLTSSSGVIVFFSPLIGRVCRIIFAHYLPRPRSLRLTKYSQLPSLPPSAPPPDRSPLKMQQPLQAQAPQPSFRTCCLLSATILVALGLAYVYGRIPLVNFFFLLNACPLAFFLRADVRQRMHGFSGAPMLYAMYLTMFPAQAAEEGGISPSTCFLVILVIFAAVPLVAEFINWQGLPAVPGHGATIVRAVIIGGMSLIPFWDMIVDVPIGLYILLVFNVGSVAAMVADSQGI